MTDRNRPVRAVRHAGIVVRDLERALAFYCGRLGFMVANRALEEGPFIATLLGLPGVRVETAKLSLPDGEAQLELLFFHHPPGLEASPPAVFHRFGPTHIALRVTDISRLYQSLTAAGIRFLAPPALAPGGRATVAFCFDPEGNPLELVEPHPE